MDAPIIIGIDNKKEYFAAEVLSLPANKPVAIVSPERENPGNAANPWDIAIKIEVFNLIGEVSFLCFEILSLNNRINPVKISNKPTISGLKTSFSAIELKGYATATETIVPKIINMPVLKSSEV